MLRMRICEQCLARPVRSRWPLRCSSDGESDDEQNHRLSDPKFASVLLIKLSGFLLKLDVFILDTRQSVAGQKSSLLGSWGTQIQHGRFTTRVEACKDVCDTLPHVNHRKRTSRTAAGNPEVSNGPLVGRGGAGSFNTTKKLGEQFL